LRRLEKIMRDRLANLGLGSEVRCWRCTCFGAVPARGSHGLLYAGWRSAVARAFIIAAMLFAVAMLEKAPLRAASGKPGSALIEHLANRAFSTVSLLSSFAAGIRIRYTYVGRPHPLLQHLASWSGKAVGPWNRGSR